MPTCDQNHLGKNIWKEFRQQNHPDQVSQLFGRVIVEGQMFTPGDQQVYADHIHMIRTNKEEVLKLANENLN